MKSGSRGNRDLRVGIRLGDVHAASMKSGSRGNRDSVLFGVPSAPVPMPQ